MSLHRTTRDSICNNEGKILLEICKSNDLFILNGRCGKDKEMGAFIFKNSSTIDYSIFSTESLKFVADFDIKELDALYSDGHSLLNTTLKFRNLVIEKPLQTKETPNQQRKWQPNKKYEFAFNLDDVKIDEIWLNLQQAHDDTPNVNKEVMNDFCSKIGNIFLESKEKSFEK